MNKYQKYIEENLVKMVHSGVSLEGAIATRLQTQQVILHGSSDVSYKTAKIIKNILEGWRYILSPNLGEPLNPLVLCNLHYGLSEGVADYLKEEDYRGRFRDFPISIGGSSYVPPVYSHDVAKKGLNLLFSTFDGSLDSVMIIYCYLMKYQFFANTNKRTAFLWVNSCLYRYDLGFLLKLPTSERGRKSFTNHLLKFYENESYLSSFVSYLKTYYLVKV